MKTRRVVPFCLLLGFLLFAAGVDRPVAGRPASGGPDTVDGVLERYVQACGGTTLAAVKTETANGTLVRHLAGQVPLTVVSEVPGKFSYRQLFAWGDQVCFGFDGGAAWVQTTTGIDDMDQGQLVDMRLMFDVQAPLNLKELYPEMALKGTEMIGEKEAVTIAARSASGIERELAFDKGTGLLARAGDVFFEDYRDVGAVKRPFRIILGRDQGEEHRRMVIQFTEILHNEAVDGFMFFRPACALPIVEAPLFRKRTPAHPSVEALEQCVGLYESPERKDLKFRIFREDIHLFLDVVGRGLKIEILPESDVDFYTKFLGWDFHFVRDKAGRVNELIVKATSTIRAVRVD